MLYNTTKHYDDLRKCLKISEIVECVNDGSPTCTKTDRNDNGKCYILHGDTLQSKSCNLMVNSIECGLAPSPRMPATADATLTAGTSIWFEAGAPSSATAAVRGTRTIFGLWRGVNTSAANFKVLI